MELLERDREREVLETAIEESLASRGVVVVVEGEAGIGKTALVTVDRGLDRAARAVGRVRPADHAAPDGPAARRRARGRRAAAPRRSTAARASDVLAARSTSSRAPAVLVIEDLHWADDATLDLVALLGRRLRALARAA